LLYSWLLKLRFHNNIYLSLLYEINFFTLFKKEEVLVNTLLISIAKRLTYSGSILFLIVLGGCASYPLLSEAEAPEVFNDYLVGPGDNVNIIVWRNPEISMSVPVRPDGKITTPLVEDLPASGKTSTQLARDIEETLSKYVQQPVVTVVVTEFVGPYSEQIRVIGEASQPQALAYREKMTLMDVLIAVGGITDFAAGNRARIIRNIDGEQMQFRVRLNDLIRDGDISANVPMVQGDVLVIPESFF
jgi:polysaccharide biosynthesis/export protein